MRAGSCPRWGRLRRTRHAPQSLIKDLEPTDCFATENPIKQSFEGKKRWGSGRKKWLNF